MIVVVSGLNVAEVDLPVGDPVRPGLGRAVFGSLLVSAGFVAFTCAAKEVSAVGAHSPWQDDPYDTMVSFAIFFIPLVTGLCAVRVPLCRRNAPLPVRRVVDLLRGSRTLLVLVCVTLASDWASVVLGAERSTWTAITGLLVGLLALFTVLTLTVGVSLLRAGRGRFEAAGAPSQPDWAADAVMLGEHAAARLGRRRDSTLQALHLLDRWLVSRARRRPLFAAAVLSLAFGAAITGVRALEEGGGMSLLLFLAVGASGMFAFLATVGAHLHLLGRPLRVPSPAVRAGVLACATIPVTLAFRNSLWWIIGQSERTAGIAAFAVLAFVVAAAAVGLVLAREALRKRR